MADIAEKPDHTTIVFRHERGEAASEFISGLLTQYPFGGDGPIVITGMGHHDVMSCADAARMVLHCRALDPYEQVELAEKMLDLGSWDDCLALAAEWSLTELDGDFVEAGQAAA